MELLDMFGGKFKDLLLKKFFKKSWGNHRELPQVAEIRTSVRVSGRKKFTVGTVCARLAGGKHSRQMASTNEYRVVMNGLLGDSC